MGIFSVCSLQLNRVIRLLQSMELLLRRNFDQSGLTNCSRFGWISSVRSGHVFVNSFRLFNQIYITLRFRVLTEFLRALLNVSYSHGVCKCENFQPKRSFLSDSKYESVENLVIGLLSEVAQSENATKEISLCLTAPVTIVCATRSILSNFSLLFSTFLKWESLKSCTNTFQSENT